MTKDELKDVVRYYVPVMQHADKVMYAVDDYLSASNDGKPIVKCNAIVTDAELTEVWGNANFGNVSKRDVVIETLKKVAQAWGTGHTAMCIVSELGLVEKRNGQTGLSDKGLMYLLASVEG